jgi:hypothetical protein
MTKSTELVINLKTGEALGPDALGIDYASCSAYWRRLLRC